MTPVQIKFIKAQAKIATRKANEKWRDAIYVRQAMAPIY